MPVSRAPGYIDLSSDGVMKATQKIYSKKTQIKFYAEDVFGTITNRDYEGDLKSLGDEVIIRTIPDTTVRPYVKDADLVYETPESSAISMTVNKAQYIATRIDRIDEKLTDINWMDKWADDGNKQMKIAIDRSILNAVWVDSASKNKGATAGYISGGYNLGVQATPLVPTNTATDHTNPVQMILNAEAALSEYNVPEDEDRFMIAPTWFINRLQSGELRRADVSGPAAAQELLRRGHVGQIGYFNIYRNNNILPDATAGGYPIIFGHKSAICFAAALTETETLKHPTKFGTIMRSLMVYDWKTIKPESLGVLWVKPS